MWCSPGNFFYTCPDVPQQIAPLVRGDQRAMILDSKGNSTNATAFLLNPKSSPSFVDEPIGSFGNISRNKYHGPGINNTNLIIAKNFALSGDGVRSLQIRMESDNVFNHTQFLNPTGTFTSGNFGLITGAAQARQTQLAA